MTATATHKPGDTVKYETDSGEIRKGTFLRLGKGGICEINTDGGMKIGRLSEKVFPLDAPTDAKSANDVDTRIAKKFDPAATPPLPFEPAKEESPLSPAMKQYQQFKEKHPDFVLFFRMGDFYEMFFDDAELTHKVLGITLTKRGDIPMAGVPFHAVEGYLRKMIAAGHKVAICEQVDGESKTPKREIVRAMTPEAEAAEVSPPVEQKPAKKPRKKKTAKSTEPTATKAEPTTFFQSQTEVPLTIRLPEPDDSEGGVRADIHFGDCIAGMESKLADNSVHLTVTSIPFEELFTYSGKPEDVGNNGSTIDLREGRFALNLRFVIAQLLRVTAPGCNVCIHIQQLLAYKNQHGFAGRRDFRGAVIDLFRAAGFLFFGEVAIPKNPQAMAQRLSLHSLQFATGYRRTSTNWAPAPNDFVLIFQKPGEVANPVRPLVYRDNSFAVVQGVKEFQINRALLPTLREAFYAAEKKSPLLYAKHLNEWATDTLAKSPKLEINPLGWMVPEDWVKWASGVWGDIDEFDIIDGARSGRDEGDEKHVCLSRGSLVLTRDGYVPIETVSVGDLVLTHKGRWRPVTAKRCMGVKPVISLEAQGIAKLHLTPEHRLWTRKAVGIGRWPGCAGGTSHPRLQAKRNEPTWETAESVKASYINLKLPPIEESPYTKDEWWLVGRWLGDGHFDARGRVHVTCAKSETEELVSAMGSRAGAITDRRAVSQIAVNDRDCRIRSILAKCGRGCDGKKLPAEALALDPEKAESLLSGYLSADGHYTEQYERWTASSISRPLLLGMAMVAQRARGVVASVYAGRRPGTCTIEGRTMKTQQDWVLSIPPRNVSAMMLKDGAWKKVRRVDPVAEPTEVWDIQVAEDESFTAEGCIVHNCPLQLELIRRLVLLYSNPITIQPDVLVLDPFMGVGSTAAVCIETDRNTVGFELKESYHRVALKNVDRTRKDRIVAVETAPMLPYAEVDQELTEAA